MKNKPFSDRLEVWLSSNSPNTLGDLSQAFEEKSFAVVIMVLMFLPALPLPTGLISHVFEVITLLLALEMIIGRHTLWLPQKWLDKELGPATQKKAVPFIARRIRWLEKYSKPRGVQVTEHRYYLPIVGLLVFILTLAALLAPPFTGLDTLPAMGVIALCLSVILSDFVLVPLGLFIGAIGVGLEIAFGLSIDKIFRHFF